MKYILYSIYFFILDNVLFYFNVLKIKYELVVVSFKIELVNWW